MTISVSSAPSVGVHPHARKRRPVGTPAPMPLAWTTVQLPAAATP
ncbi:MAG: hypothetical protein JWM98_2601, partial [Thermoleophilia bacterium]|nr:hypothetical protein [Thermoleophilia bacterium]